MKDEPEAVGRVESSRPAARHGGPRRLDPPYAYGLFAQSMVRFEGCRWHGLGRRLLEPAAAVYDSARADQFRMARDLVGEDLRVLENSVDPREDARQLTCSVVQV